MSEEQAPEQPQEPAARPEPRADDTDWKAEARKWEQRAKDNKATAAELEKQRLATMTEAEKAVAEAERRGRQTATAEFGKRLARTQFDALAGRRNPTVDTNSVLEYIDLGRFVTDDGEPNEKAIAAAVERLVPEPVTATETKHTFDLGNRGTVAPRDDGMNQLIRRSVGR